MNLSPFVTDAFKELDWLISQDPNQKLVYHRGIPILYFGNLQAYVQSSFKVVTAALNPADSELRHEGIYSTRHRFPSYNPILREETYLKALDSYFEEKPYDWFSLGFEPVLNGLGSSYFSKKNFENRVLHTDIGSPVCTKILWSNKDFPKQTKERLVINGKKLWFDLIKELNPDLILISINEKLMEDVFGSAWKSKAVPVWNSKDAARKRGTQDVLESGIQRQNPYVAYSFTHPDLPTTKIVWGKANVKPFGDLAFKKEPKPRNWLGEDLQATLL